MSVAAYLKDSWKDITLYAESVPHLLHWDLAYLWVLEREPETRPDCWKPLLAAWEKLLQLFLAGRLRIEDRRLPRPLLDFTEPYGITQIRLLHLDTLPVGVLSPTVIVRPFPDPTPELDQIQLSPTDLGRATHCLEILRRNLRDLLQPDPDPTRTVDRSLQHQLNTVLSRLNWGPAGRCPVSFIDVDLLRTVSFHAATAQPGLDRVPIAVGRQSDAEQPYVPHCATCPEPLTHENRIELAREISDDYVTLECPRGHRNNLPLEKLFLWKRQFEGVTEYVYWTDRRSSFPAIQEVKVDWPPVPKESGGHLLFLWDPGYLGGERQKIALRLKLPPGARFRAASVRDHALYPTLLAPGHPEHHQGIPIRWEWRDAWAGCESVLRDPGCIHYRGVRLSGLPFRFHWAYTTHGLSLRIENELYPGIYPKQMHERWKPYRVLALSRPDQQWTVKVAGGRGLLSCLRETQGWPEWISLEDAAGNCGATWRVQPAPPPAPQTTGTMLSIGVDFGTSASVVYFSGGSDALTTTQNALHLTHLRDLVHWLGPKPPDEFHEAGWFLPRSPQDGQDPCLIPSALWVKAHGADEGYVRWADMPPGEWISVHGFKWDERLENRRAQRQRFIKEILFFSLPCILERLGNRHACPPLRLGFAYPLAFDFNQRQDFAQVLDHVRNWLETQAGFELPEIFSLNESLAAVRAYGMPELGDQFLIADMGGHTLDVSLFEYQAEPKGESFFQVGSIEFGGEKYLERVADHTLSGQEREARYWRLRDTIFAGQISRYATHGDMCGTLDRFHIMALEYLRVMLAAHRQRPAAATKPVRLVLIGNGWRLRELTAGGQAPEAHLQDYFDRMVGKFGVSEVTLQHVSLSGVPWSKHWVAIGALKNAAAGGYRELRDPAPYPEKLPAGKDLTIAGQDIHWQDMVGAGAPALKDETRLTKDPCRCDFQTGPAAPAEWSNHLERAVPAHSRYPRDEEMREWLFAAVHNARLRKGPLQLILENHWRRSL